VILLIFFPPAWPILIIYYLMRGSSASRRTARATERIAAVVAPEPRVRFGFEVYVILAVLSVLFTMWVNHH